jgi:hypothetical protein
MEKAVPAGIERHAPLTRKPRLDSQGPQGPFQWVEK